MSDPKPVIPVNAQQLLESLTKLEKNRSHFRASVNPATSHLEVKLDGWAHTFGHTPDFYLPIKAKRAHDAQELLDRLGREAEAGTAPSLSEAQQLFDMIDPNPQ